MRQYLINQPKSEGKINKISRAVTGFLQQGALFQTTRYCKPKNKLSLHAN